MFNITRNDIVNNKVWYEDEFENTLFIKRKENGFVAKIRFKDKSVKSKPIEVDVDQIKIDGGVNLNFEYPSGRSQYDEDISAGIQGLTEIVQRWTEMINDLKFINNAAEFLPFIRAQYMKEDVSAEEVASYKMAIMNQYEELGAVLNMAGIL